MALADLPPIFFCALLLLSYSAASLQQFICRRNWSIFRVASFYGGIGLILYAIAPSQEAHAHHSFTHHMMRHLLIGMIAPTLLVLAAPVSLALRALPRQYAKALARVLQSPPMQLWCHPITALIFNFGGMFALYLTPLYQASLTNLWLHHFIHFHFLVAGYLFAWALVGPDPAPARPSFPTRLVILLIAMASHGIFSKLMYIHLFPLGTSHDADDIRAAAQLMYYGGDLAEVLLAILLFAAWRKQVWRRRRPEQREPRLASSSESPVRWDDGSFRT